MTRAATALAVLVAAFVVTSVASAQATLERSAPAGGSVAAMSPEEVELGFSESVEPSFARVSVTGADGRPHTDGTARAGAGGPATVVAPLGDLAEGWYLVYWRVVSQDGRPARGAYAFAVGLNPGPAPEFVIPSTSETAATPRLVATRWLALLAVLAAIGIFCLAVTASSRRLVVAFAAASAAALVLTPLYVLLATAQFALRSAFDLGSLAPLLNDSALGRGFLAFELGFALFVGVAAVALRRGSRPLAFAGLALAAIALLLPGLYGSGDAAAVLAGWLYLAAGALLLGGLVGLLVLPERRVPKAALAVLAVFVGAGTGVALLDLPNGSWDSSYGNALVAGFALLTVLLVTGVVLARAGTKSAAAVGGVVIVVSGTLLASVIAASVARPAQALDSGASTQVGPGRVVQAVEHDGYRVELRVDPNRAGVSNRFDLYVTQDGAPVTGAGVNAGFSMLEMEMGQQDYRLPETAPGVYGRAAPAFVMVGHWELVFEIAPNTGDPFTVRFVDETTG